MLQFLLNYVFSAITSFYSLSFTGNNGAVISMSQFKDKPVLIVNIATASPRASQLSELQRLQEKFSDSLVIIAFPSASFGNEQRTDAEIANFCHQQYATTFTIAEKGPVTGAVIQPVYNWLTVIEENGASSGGVSGDFQKFLVNRKGELIGIFSSSIHPDNVIIENAIRSSYND